MKRRASGTRARKTTTLPPSGTVSSDPRLARAEARAAEAEAALEAARARASALVENAPVPVFAKDAEGRYTIWNPAAAAVSQLPSDAVVGRTDRELFGSEIAAQYVCQDDEVVRSGVSRTYEVQLELPDGLHDHRVVKFPVPSSERGPEVYGIVLDETRERRLSADLLRSQRLESTGRLAAGVAHDLSNVLMALRSYVSLLENDPRIPREETRRELGEMHATIDRGAALIRQLLAFGRRPSSTPQLIVVDELVLELAPILERFVDAPVALSLEIDHRMPLTVRADPLHLEQVIVNLVVNARDAIQAEGNIVLSVTVEGDEGSDRPTWVRIAVRDDGPGMDAATKARIFEPFFTTKGAAGGTGLGLATSLEMVRGAGGELAVDSAPGRGTTMLVRLPWVEEVAEPVRAVVPAEVPRGDEAVLLVVEDPCVRSIVARMLGTLGYRVTSAASRDDALSLAVAGHFDLVVSDEPRADGLAARLRAVAPDLPLLFVGSEPRAEHAEALLELGARVLVTPLDPRALAGAVRERLDAGRWPPTQR